MKKLLLIALAILVASCAEKKDEDQFGPCPGCSSLVKQLVE
jgi:hypothetical protein